MPKFIPESLKQEIRRKYMERPISYSGLSKEFHICKPTITKIVEDLPKYNKSQIYNPNMNEDYFEVIDTQFKAYFLGLIISDGNVFDPTKSPKLHQKTLSTSITLDNADKYILEAFKNEIGMNNAISGDGRGCSYIAVRSDKIANDLSKYGVVPCKSFKTYLPILAKEMMPHLIRGIFDGDGSIDAKMIKSGRFMHKIAFCGTHRLMEEIIKYYDEEVGFVGTTPKVYDYKNRLLSELHISNMNDIYRFGQWIYKDSKIHLHRKRNKFENFIKHYKETLEQQGNTEVRHEIAQGS